jgi:hypothetical protein
MSTFDLSGPYDEVCEQTVTGVISLYEMTVHYGGPEEGGWHYYREHFVAAVVPVIAQRMGDVLDEVRYVNGHLKDQADRYGDGPFVTIERFPGESDTSDRPRPHYE